jgi:hypothetical protein
MFSIQHVDYVLSKGKGRGKKREKGKDLFDLFKLPVYNIIQSYKWSPGC